MGKKKATVFLTSLLLLLLSGCFSWTPEDCYALPQPPEDYQNLMSKIAETRRELAAQYSTTVEDVPPSAGDNTSTVQLLDMDGDDTLETAVTFFRVVGAENPIRIYFYELQPDESYKVSHVVEGEGSSVYAVHYVDLDGQEDPLTGRKKKEVVVGWQMGTDAYFLGAYALNDLEATPLMMTAYQSCQLLDLDRDGLTELAVCRLNAETRSGGVEVYKWNAAGLESVYQAPLSGTLDTVRQMRADYLTDMIPALYVSCDLSDGSRVTDIIAFQDGELTNLSLDPETGISREQTTVYRDTAVSDVNGDYILEVARPRELPAYGSSSPFWLLDWVQYDVSGQARSVCTTYYNSADGWYLIIPRSWQDQLTIYRNDSVSGQRTVIFALWQGEDKEPIPFLSIYKLTGASRTSRATSGSRFILAEDSSTIYSAAFYTTWDCGLDQTELLENFRLIVPSWSGA